MTYFYDSSYAQHWRAHNNVCSGWNWGKVLACWRSEINDSGIFVDDLFTTKNLHDPAHPTGRAGWMLWWPADEVDTLHMHYQSVLDRHPGAAEDFMPNPCTKGEICSLSYLWDEKSDPDRLAAVLLAASLFPRLYGRGNNYPASNWPAAADVGMLASWVWTAWQGSYAERGWHPLCTTVLPYKRADRHHELPSMEALVRYLATEHAILLMKYRPIRFEFTPERDPVVARALNEKYAREKLSRQDQETQRKARDADEKARQAAFALAHPLASEWQELDAAKLTELVWTRPTIEIAALFGVSDVAIGKRCRTLGVSKPPRGFWTKVAAGSVSHPQGKPLSK
jgi:hypothetical protein